MVHRHCVPERIKTKRPQRRKTTPTTRLVAHAKTQRLEITPNHSNVLCKDVVGTISLGVSPQRQQLKRTLGDEVRVRIVCLATAPSVAIALVITSCYCALIHNPNPQRQVSTCLFPTSASSNARIVDNAKLH